MDIKNHWLLLNSNQSGCSWGKVTKHINYFENRIPEKSPQLTRLDMFISQTVKHVRWPKFILEIIPSKANYILKLEYRLRIYFQALIPQCKLDVIAISV